MNLVGKIFVILVLVMSVLFMGLAVSVYSVHRDWEALVLNPKAELPDRPLGLKFQLENELKARREAQEKLEAAQEQFAQELAARRNQLGKLQQELALVRDERDRLQAQEAQLQSDLRQAVALVNTAQTTLGERLTEEQTLKQDLDAARADGVKHFGEAVALTDQLNQAESEVTRLKANNTNLSKQLADARIVMDRFGVPANAPVSGVPPKVDGVILASDPQGMVEISLGSHDGLHRGHRLEVFRLEGPAPKYLGRVEVLQTTPDRAVAKVLPEFRKGTIQKDDRVATRLN